MDRFFTSVKLLQSLPYAIVGTCQANRKNVPEMPGKLKRGESTAKCTTDGTIIFKWQDSKEVLLLSNCHKNVIKTADRKQKDGSIKTFDCPEAIVFYNEMMGGVDKADQYSTTYEINRKSNKWWKRVFHRLLMVAVSNSWIVFQKLRGKKSSLINYLIPLGEQFIIVGNSVLDQPRKAGRGRPPKKQRFLYTIGHQPTNGGTKRRCTYCASKQIQKRTLYLCDTCDLPLCMECFQPYHK